MTIFDRHTPPGKSPRGKLTAEERLLEVIQNGGELPTVEKGSRFAQRFRAAVQTGREWYHRIRSGWKSARGRLGQRPAPGAYLVRLNWGLGAAIVVVVVLSIFTTFLRRPTLGWVHSLVAEASSPLEADGFKPTPLEEFLGPITSRDLFQPGGTEKGAATTTAGAAAKSPPPVWGSIEALELVGLAWGEYPEAMLREGKGGRTVFLKQGEAYKGIVVKEIRSGSVILESGGEEKELM